MEIERINDRFGIAVGDGQVMQCSEPGCTEGHVANFVLFDHKLRVQVAFESRDEALQQVARFESDEEDTDISTVGGLIEYLKTLPQDAAVYVADGETYRFQDDYPDWDEADNAKFPIETVAVERGLTMDEQKERVRTMSGIVNPEVLLDTITEDEPKTIVTLVGVR
jgi:hypothetical protein